MTEHEGVYTFMDCPDYMETKSNITCSCQSHKQNEYCSCKDAREHNKCPRGY